MTGASEVASNVYGGGLQVRAVAMHISWRLASLNGVGPTRGQSFIWGGTGPVPPVEPPLEPSQFYF